MAKAISSEELQLKKRARRRLVGAIALVLIVVVFLPMILDNEPRPMSQDIAINIPPVPQELVAEPKPAEPLTFKPVEPAGDTESGRKKAAAASKPANHPASPQEDKKPAAKKEK